MRVSIRTRKPCDKLKVADFTAFPIWEFALDEEDKPGRDESWVRPVESSFVPKGAYSLLVATTFVTASGKKLNGFMTVSTDTNQVEIYHAQALGRLKFTSIPEKSRDKWDIEERKKFLKLLGQPESKVYPIQYTLRVMIQGEKTARQGKIK